MEAPVACRFAGASCLGKYLPLSRVLPPRGFQGRLAPEATQRHILAKNWHSQSFIQALLHPRCACQLTRPADWGVPLSWGSGVVLGWLGPEQMLHDANCSGPHLWLDHFDIGQWDWGK